jgi:hypothetical protein
VHADVDVDVVINLQNEIQNLKFGYWNTIYMIHT